MLFEISHQTLHENVVLTLAGRFDFHGYNTFPSALKAILFQKTRAVIVHLGNLQFIDSLGMGPLMLIKNDLLHARIPTSLVPHNHSYWKFSSWPIWTERFPSIPPNKLPYDAQPFDRGGVYTSDCSPHIPGDWVM